MSLPRSGVMFLVCLFVRPSFHSFVTKPSWILFYNFWFLVSILAFSCGYAAINSCSDSCPLGPASDSQARNALLKISQWSHLRRRYSSSLKQFTFFHSVVRPFKRCLNLLLLTAFLCSCITSCNVSLQLYLTCLIYHFCYLMPSDQFLLDVRTTVATGRPCSLPHRPSHISESCLSQPAAWTTTTKRREQDRI